MWGAIFSILAGVVAGIAVAAILNWETISNWFQQNKTSNSAYGLILKEALASGDYNVVVGVLNHSGDLLSAAKWENTQIDHEVLQEFGQSNSLIFELSD